MTTELSFEPRIPTKRGSIALASLRPGAFLRGPTGTMFCVLINSKKLSKIVLRSDADDTEFSHRYEDIRDSVAFMGNGEPRLWWPFLPKWLRKQLCPYRLPQPKKNKSPKR